MISLGARSVDNSLASCDVAAEAGEVTILLFLFLLFLLIIYVTMIALRRIAVTQPTTNPTRAPRSKPERDC